MKKGIYKEKTQKVKVDEFVYCDVCQQKIDCKQGYYFIRTGHNDWGNDSGDSVEHFDICGKKCLQKMFDEYIDRSDAIFNSHYLEVEHIKGYVTTINKGE